MLSGITSSIIGLLGGLLGYAFREYRNRIKPFFQLLNIDGSVRRGTDRHKVDDSIVSEIKDAFHISDVGNKEYMHYINESYKEAKEVEDNWPEYRDLIDKIESSESKKVFQENLRELLAHLRFERWVIKILLGDMIDFDHKNLSSKESKMEVYKDKDENRSKFVWMEFPGGTIKFGYELNSRAVESKVMPFIKSIKSLDKEIICDLLEQIRKVIQKEYEIASQVTEDMKEILDENSRWVFYSYIANIRKSPFAIKDKVSLEIEDPAGSSFIQECYIANLNVEGEETRISDVNYPLIVGPESEMKFAIIT